MMKRFIVRMTLPVLEKARRSPRLIPVKKMVTRDGKVFQTTVWMLPEDVKAGKTGGAQGSLFDDIGPAPVIQGDLFDQASDESRVENNEGLSRLIARETKETEGNGGKVYPVEIAGKKYYVELEGTFGWKNRGQDAVIRNEKWEIVKTQSNPKNKSKTALIEWANNTLAGAKPKAKPQDVSGMRIADGDFPKDILRDGEKIGRITEARLNGKVVSYNVRNLAGNLVASGKTPESALEQFKTGVKKEEPTEPFDYVKESKKKPGESFEDWQKRSAEVRARAIKEINGRKFSAKELDDIIAKKKKELNTATGMNSYTLRAEIEKLEKERKAINHDVQKPEEFTFKTNGDTKTARITLEDRPTISGKTKQVKVISVYGSKDKETPEWTKQVEKDELVARSWVERLHKKYGKNESGGAAKESAESESKKPDESLSVGSTKTENGVTYRLNENHRWEKVEEPGSERKLIKKGDGADRNGAVVQDENGKNWLVVSSRSAWITACPIVGGKPQVNADDKKTFHLDEHKIYDTGKVWDYKENRPVDKKESDKPEWAKDPAPSKTIEVESSITDNNVKTTLFKYDEGSLKGKFGIKTTDLDSGKTLPTVFQYSDEEKAREKYRELAGIKKPETSGDFDENRRKLVYANYHDQAEDKIYSAYEKAKEKGRKEDIKAIEDVLSDKKLPLVRNVNDGKTPEGTYKYLMKLRPFGGGAQPEGNIIGFETVDKTKDGGWSVVEYMEPLSKEQLEHFSMEPYKDSGISTHHVGETKWVNGSQYRLNENHRWEKVDAGEPAKEEMAQDSPSGDGKETLASLIERAGGKEKLKTMLLTARKAEREGQGSQIDLSSGEVVNRTTDKVLDGLSNASGLTREEVLAELGIKEGRKPTSKKPKKEKAKTDSGDELDPNSENYKFKDTGYIAGSRKELASERIKDMAEKGQLVRRTDIPWEDLEKNPRQAQTLITKSNLFGSVQWGQLKENGLEPGAGFLIDRIYASVAKEPKDNAASRKDYVYGLESLRDRLEKSKTVGDVLNVLKEIKGEIDGEVYSAREADEYKAAMEELNALAKQERDYKERRDYLAHEANRVGQEISGLKYEKQKRENRGWKVDPEVIKKIAALEKEYEKKLSAHKAFVESHPEMKQETIKHGTWDTGMTYEYRGEFLDKYNAARKKVSDVRKAVVSRNLLENDTTRAWLSLGDRFSAVINYRSFKGSDAFGNHVANARAGNIKDWDWAEKGRITGKKATKESVQFQLKVAEKFERKGGRKISVDSTMALKSMFNLRDVQSGNWVLRDVNSAKFHTENTAMALADMADLLGIPDSQVSLNGRLAMAFGARGSGSAGWSKGAAKAHYEHVQRVINITKNGGGGSLGHEWFHAFDNMLMETMSGEPTGKDIMLTEDPSQVSDPDVRKAFEGIRSAMLDGSVIPPKKITYTMQDYRNAEYGFKRDYGRYGEIKKTGSAQKAVEYLYSLYEKYDVENPTKYDKKALKQRDDWVRTAVAWFDKKEGGGSVTVNIGKPVSSFLMGARDLDKERSKDYWSSPREMAARAFQSYLEDRLSEKGQKNDYLSVYADNKYHRDPLTGVEFKPYPEGEERKQINEAFDKLFEVVRSKKLIQKAIEIESGKARMVKVWRFA